MKEKRFLQLILPVSSFPPGLLECTGPPVLGAHSHRAALVWNNRTPGFFPGPLSRVPCVSQVLHACQSWGTVGLHVDDGTRGTGAMVLQRAGELSGTSRADSHFSCLGNLLGVHRHIGQMNAFFFVNVTPRPNSERAAQLCPDRSRTVPLETLSKGETIRYFNSPPHYGI